MSAFEWLTYLLLAFALGTAGQLVRVAVGFKKMHDKNLATNTKTTFDPKKFWTSIILGAMAGLITAVVKWQGEPPRVLRRLQLLREWSHEQIE